MQETCRINKNNLLRALYKTQETCRINKNNLIRELYIFQFFTCCKLHFKNMIHGTTSCIKDIEATLKFLFILPRTDNGFHQNLETAGSQSLW